MDKAELIARTIKHMKRTMVNQPPCIADAEEAEFIVSVLQDVLPMGDIRTCEDFKHLNVRCCETCHDNPHYEMSVILLPDGFPAWVCDEVKHAIYPEKYRTRLETEQMLMKIFGDALDSQAKPVRS
jgi:hypothetical protein